MYSKLVNMLNIFAQVVLLNKKFKNKINIRIVSQLLQNLQAYDGGLIAVI